jgi:hypothetical protein
MSLGSPPTLPEPDQKVSIEHAPEPPLAATDEELQARTAARVRADSRERRALTSTAAVAELAPGEPRERLNAILAAMGCDERYADIKAVITDNGAAYLYSERDLTSAEAVERAFVEECEQVIAASVRADSEHRAALTSADALRALLPPTEQGRLAEILARLEADPRYFDLKAVAGPGGETFLHSDLFLGGDDARLLARGGAADPCATVAELVREASRAHPRPTRCRPFWARIFGVAPEQLAGIVEELLRRPDCADIAKLVHPGTGAVYLYSTRYLDEAQAFAIADWEEVGRDENP